MALGDVPETKTLVAGLLGGLALGIPAAIQNPQDRVFAFSVFWIGGALMAAGLIAFAVPTTCDPAKTG